MSEHKATIQWTRQSPDFLKGKYSREHTWSFDGGAVVPASPSPSVVPIPYSNPACVDPEEAFVASVCSCHMLTYLALKFLHVIGAAVLLGTGAGIAFFMLLAHRTGDAATVASVARIVVIADFVFTATAVVVQPITGGLLAWIVGYSLLDGWILLSIALYLLTGAFWLPVVWMQMRMRDLAAEAVREAKPLPAQYHRLFRLWFAFGFPAFGAVVAIFWLMIAKPQLG